MTDDAMEAEARKVVDEMLEALPPTTPRFFGSIVAPILLAYAQRVREPLEAQIKLLEEMQQAPQRVREIVAGIQSLRAQLAEAQAREDCGAPPREPCKAPGGAPCWLHALLLEQRKLAEAIDRATENGLRAIEAVERAKAAEARVEALNDALVELRDMAETMISIVGKAAIRAISARPEAHTPEKGER